MAAAISNPKPTLLAVLAHPDDETFGMGATLALYARRGVDVHLITATRGEAGEMPAELLRGFTDAGARREAELRCAAETLGLKEVTFLGYRDSGMPGAPDNEHPDALAAQPLERVAADVADAIRRVRPQVVVTFDPIGGYRHPDHIAIHRATVAAFDLAADPDADLPERRPAHRAKKLYYHVIPRGLLRAGVFVLRVMGRDPRKFGNNGDIDLAALAEVSFPIHAVIDTRRTVAIQAEAAACHASQGGAGMFTSLQGRLMRLFGGKDRFMRAYPHPNGDRRERDLFAGIEALG